ncbi:hypothetical protein NUM_44010 [Actinocatenispora comari]|uniref:Uncharacterized protein n=1 Tax=Actinocatenispora comari TaxID=2807577 RepID=A0A8J4AH61_9ACTN|nr:hypothetical protein NUM_44010 [Actinocatenispora comari]
MAGPVGGYAAQTGLRSMRRPAAEWSGPVRRAAGPIDAGETWSATVLIGETAAVTTIEYSRT